MASRGVNKVILIGNLGQDPEIRYMPNGSAVANITLATSESWRDKQNDKIREKTEWHRVVIFGKLAEVAGEYLHKGSQVYIEGSLQTRKWQDQNGYDRYSTEVVVNIGGTMQMLGVRSNLQEKTISQSNTTGGWSGVQSQQSQQTRQEFSNSNNITAISVPPSSYSEKIAPVTTAESRIDFDDDDIPF